jgi:hypothetical protein
MIIRHKFQAGFTRMGGDSDIQVKRWPAIAKISRGYTVFHKLTL